MSTKEQTVRQLKELMLQCDVLREAIEATVRQLLRAVQTHDDCSPHDSDDDLRAGHPPR